MLYVNHTQPIGTVTVTAKPNRSYECTLYTCNGMFAAITESGEAEHVTKDLVFFIADYDHLKNCLGISKRCKGNNCLSCLSNLTLYMGTGYFRDADITRIAGLFAKAGIDATLTKLTK